MSEKIHCLGLDIWVDSNTPAEDVHEIRRVCPGCSRRVGCPAKPVVDARLVVLEGEAILFSAPGEQVESKILTGEL